VILKKEHPKLFEVINQLPGDSFSEKAWQYSHNSSKVKCEVCSNFTKFLDFGRGYAKLCSRKCTGSSNSAKLKRINTTQNKYGSSHFSKTNEYKIKFRETCIIRYGVVNPGQISSLKKQRSKAKQLTFYKKLIEDIQQFSRPNFSFDEYTHVRDKELSWSCVICGNEFTSNAFGKLPKCPKCYPPGNIGDQSSVEKDVLFEVRKFYSGEIIENSRNIIKPKEIDIYFPDKKLAIEINGVYWHSNKHLDNNYHQEKFNICNLKGISLLMITDHEWKVNREIIIKMIKYRLGCCTGDRIHTRKCHTIEIDSTSAKNFLNNNHLNGYCNATKHLGLFTVDEKLVSVLSYNMSNRFKKDNSDIEIIRFAVDGIIPGALGKFIKYFKKTYPIQQIVTYADLRYGAGNIYTINNFILIHTTKPGYWYFWQNNIYHRLNWTKQKLIKLGYNSNKTEKQIMEEIGALRIYDCGHRYFKLEINHE
jgi:very-short-patch-repair endonuclease